MKLQVAERAQQLANRIEAWWVANRPAAPTLFLDELEETFRYICRVRSAGVGWPTPRHPNLRRILMKRTNNQVYFVINASSDTVHVHAIWGAPKGRIPKLQSAPSARAVVVSRP